MKEFKKAGRKAFKQCDKMFLPFRIRYGVKYSGKTFIMSLHLLLKEHNNVLGQLNSDNSDIQDTYSYSYLENQMIDYFSKVWGRHSSIHSKMEYKDVERLLSSVMYNYAKDPNCSVIWDSLVLRTLDLIKTIPPVLVDSEDFRELFSSMATIIVSWWTKSVSENLDRLNNLDTSEQ